MTTASRVCYALTSNLDGVGLYILDAEFSHVSIIRPGHNASDHKDWNPSEKR